MTAVRFSVLVRPYGVWPARKSTTAAMVARSTGVVNDAGAVTRNETVCAAPGASRGGGARPVRTARLPSGAVIAAVRPASVFSLWNVYEAAAVSTDFQS